MLNTNTQNIVTNLIKLSFGPLCVDVGNWKVILKLTNNPKIYYRREVILDLLQCDSCEYEDTHLQYYLPISYFNELRNEYKQYIL